MTEGAIVLSRRMDNGELKTFVDAPWPKTALFAATMIEHLRHRSENSIVGDELTINAANGQARYRIEMCGDGVWSGTLLGGSLCGAGSTVSSRAVVGSNFVMGARSNVWHFANIEDDVVVGDDAAIGSHSYVGRGARIGNGARIQSFVSICRNAVIGERVFVSPHVQITDDKHPKAGNPGYRAEPPVLMDGCSIGAGAIILPGVTIGRDAMVGAGAVVVHDVPDGGIVVGIPARAAS